MSKKIKSLTKAEEQVMQVLWVLNEGTTHDVLDKFPKPKPHYNTVSTILKILAEKKFVSIKQLGKVNFYKPVVEKEVYSKRSVKQIVQDYFDGSFANMLSAFTSSKELTAKDLDDILNELQKHK